MPNPVVHFEIQSNQAGELQEFYSKLFGWKIDANNPMSYGIVDTESEGISGGIGPAMGSNGLRDAFSPTGAVQQPIDPVFCREIPEIPLGCETRFLTLVLA